MTYGVSYKVLRQTWSVRLNMICQESYSSIYRPKLLTAVGEVRLGFSLPGSYKCLNMICQLLVGHTRDCYSKGRYARLGISDANDTMTQRPLQGLGVGAVCRTDFTVQFRVSLDKSYSSTPSYGSEYTAQEVRFLYLCA